MSSFHLGLEYFIFNILSLFYILTFPSVIIVDCLIIFRERILNHLTFFCDIIDKNYSDWLGMGLKLKVQNQKGFKKF